MILKYKSKVYFDNTKIKQNVILLVLLKNTVYE